MSSLHLQRQYCKLYHHYQGSTVKTNVSDIAEVLFCTKRNARNVLGKLTKLAWIHWSPVTGRSKQSQLQFLNSTAGDPEYLAQEYVAQGKVEMALSILNNNASKLALLLSEHMGGLAIDGKQILRIPYYRSFPVISPRQPIRRSERHLIRYILEGLTRINEEKGEAIAAIAHHWEQIDSLTWRFYIRSNLRFHNGSYVSIDDIKWSLGQTLEHQAFAHIKSFVAIGCDVIEIHLKTPDHSLPILMAQNIAMITPRKSSNSPSFPVGTGAFKVVRNDADQLILESFNNYYSELPILDRVEFWKVPNMPSTYLYPSHITNHKTQLGFTPKQHALDNGSLYLIVNKTKVLGENASWCNYLFQLLNPISVFQSMLHNNHSYRFSPAFGLLPSWSHTSSFSKLSKPNGMDHLSLAYDPHNPMHPILVTAIKQLLLDVGIELDELVYSAEENTREVLNADLILDSFSIISPVSISMINWFYQYDHMKRIMTAECFLKYNALIEDWRQHTTSNISNIAEEIGQKLVSEQYIIPLLHPWNGINTIDGLCSAHANQIGWLDFNKVWFKSSVNTNGHNRKS